MQPDEALVSGIRATLIPMLRHTLFVFLMQYQVLVEPMRPEQIADLALKSRIQEHEETARRRAAAQRRLFEQRFNALAKAVETFGDRYNEGNGQIWPKREADQLRKALAEFQELPAFRDGNKGTKR